MPVDRSGWTREQLERGAAAADVWIEHVRRIQNWQQRLLEAFAYQPGRPDPAGLSGDERAYLDDVREHGELRPRRPSLEDFERPERDTSSGTG